MYRWRRLALVLILIWGTSHVRWRIAGRSIVHIWWWPSYIWFCVNWLFLWNRRRIAISRLNWFYVSIIAFRLKDCWGIFWIISLPFVHLVGTDNRRFCSENNFCSWFRLVPSRRWRILVPSIRSTLRVVCGLLIVVGCDVDWWCDISSSISCGCFGRGRELVMYFLVSVTPPCVRGWRWEVLFLYICCLRWRRREIFSSLELSVGTATCKILKCF